ncbi:MAG TPA: ABC transporter substrate-binding protein [Methanocorpusculum sp.]|nr:ABC transporter substrate-binding protein [Methanocorpusculum sp.]
MKKTTCLFIALIIVLVFCTGAAFAGETREFTDDLGRGVTLPVEIDSVAPSGMLAQVIIYAVAPESLATVASPLNSAEKVYLDPRLQNLEVTGSFYGAKSTMNPEEIMQLDRMFGFDAVIDLGTVKKGIADDLNSIQEKTGVNFVFISQDKLEDYPTSFRRMGELLNRPETAGRQAAYLENLLSEVDENMQKVPKRATMIYVTMVDGNSVYLIGSGENSEHGDAINKVAVNVAPPAVSVKGIGDVYSMEQILMLDPDYIIVGQPDSGDYYNMIMTSPSWQSLRAVQEGHVYESPKDPYPWMGNPRSVNRFLSLLWLGNLFYPEVFDFNMQDRAVEFYDLFYHHTLTDAEYKGMTEHSFAGSGALVPESGKSPVPLAGLIIGLAAAVFAVRRK